MIIEIIFIVAMSIALVILVRKLPSVIKLDFNRIKEEALKKTDPNKKVHAFWQKDTIKLNDNDTTNKFMFFKKNNNLENLFEEADKLFADEKYSEAEQKYLQIAMKDPKNVRVYNRLGVVYMEKGNFYDAKESFLVAVKLDPKKASRYYNLSMAQAEMKEYRSALESLEKAIKIEPNNKKYIESVEDLKQKINYRHKESKRVDD